MMEIEDFELGGDPTDDGGLSSAVMIDAALKEANQARQTGDFSTAIEAYTRVIAMDSDHTVARLALAEVYRISGHPREALQACIKLLEVDSGHMGARVEMAEALHLIGRNDEAHAIHDLLLHERPDSPQTWCGLARLLADEGHAFAAETCLRRAQILSPGHAPSLAALAHHLARTGRHAEAIDLFYDAIALAPEDPSHHIGMGVSLLALGRVEETEPRLDRALALDSENPAAHLARADLLVMTGRLEESWPESEWRSRQPGRTPPILPGIPWGGEAMDGGALLLYADQSLSDTLRLLRFLARPLHMGARLILLVQPGLIPLLAPMDGVDRVYGHDRPLPLDIEVDAYAALGDLPRLLEFKLDSIPETPWLEAPPRRRRPVVVPPDTALKVGLGWAGRDQNAAVAFQHLLPLAEIPGIVLFALEFSLDPQAAATLADPSLVTDLGPTVADYADLAGRIAELDVVVAADCATAHLAGAMGKPVLLLLPPDAHPRWMRGTDRSPWYPTMRLFRRRREEDWSVVIGRVRDALADLVVQNTEALAELRRQVCGSSAAQLAFLTAHLRPGDLLVDCQSGDGAFIPNRDDMESLAIDPSPRTCEALWDRFRTISTVEVINAALGADGIDVLASPLPRGGRRVFAVPPGIPGHTRTQTLGSVLAARPGFAARRLVIRLGQTGWESLILAGLGDRQAHMVIFEHRLNGAAAGILSDAGFHLWRFPTETAFGPVTVFDHQEGPVLALAPGLEPTEHYGPKTLPPSPEHMAEAKAEAERLTQDGLGFQASRRLGEAAAAYAQALMRDPFAAGANANKGVMMHMAGRREAAASCYRRALTSKITAGVAGNLGTALRELRRFDEADTVIRQALDSAPGNPDFLYDLALLRRDQGRLSEAADLLRQIRTQRAGADWTLAQVLLAMGHQDEGLALFAARPTPPSPQPGLPMWQGEDLAARLVLVYQDCDLADAVLMARAFALLAIRGGLVVIYCQPELAPLLTDLPGVEQVICGDEPIPACDLHIPFSQLLRLLGPGSAAIRQPHGAYLPLPGHIRPRRFTKDNRLRVGLSWGGRPASQACTLAHMLNLAADPDIAITALGDAKQISQIQAIGAHILVEEVIPPPEDLAETAGLIATMDVVVGGDTPELHLAAAMGKPVWLLRPDAFTWRWPRGRDDSPWYPSARVFHQSSDGSWEMAITRIAAALKVLATGKRG